MAQTILTDRRGRFVCVGVLGVVVVVVAVAFATARDGRTWFGSMLGGDYAAFYVAGRILNEHGGDRLYDLQLQHQLYHELFPAAEPGVFLPFANAPFFALLFRPLARLPFAWSFAVWLAIGLTLFAAGVARWDRRWLLPALAFEPFVIECWVGGQVAAFGFAAVSVAVWADRRERSLLAGGVLALCLYKPTWLVAVLPMLVVGRRWRVLAGFAGGAAALGAVSWLAVGGRAGEDYVGVLTRYAQATGENTAVFRTWKFVDVASFVRLLAGDRATAAGWVFVAVVITTWLAWLGREWWRGDGHRERLWAATLAGTAVFNVYVGIYDAVLALPALLMLPVRWLAVTAWALPWVAQEIARVTGVPLLTPVLAAVAFCALAGVRRFP